MNTQPEVLAKIAWKNFLKAGPGEIRIETKSYKKQFIERFKVADFARLEMQAAFDKYCLIALGRTIERQELGVDPELKLNVLFSPKELVSVLNEFFGIVKNVNFWPAFEKGPGGPPAFLKIEFLLSIFCVFYLAASYGIIKEIPLKTMMTIDSALSKIVLVCSHGMTYLNEKAIPGKENETKRRAGKKANRDLRYELVWQVKSRLGTNEQRDEKHLPAKIQKRIFALRDGKEQNPELVSAYVQAEPYLKKDEKGKATISWLTIKRALQRKDEIRSNL